MTETAILVAADFRTATVQWWTTGLTLTTAEVSDANLTAIIAAVSEQIEDWCFDHFETLTAFVDTFDGWDLRELDMRERIQSITSVEIKQYGGTYVTLNSTFYEVHKSLESDSTVRIDGRDYLSVAYGTWLPTPSGLWPHGSDAVRVTGNFGWTACPDPIRRAAALLVWDHVKPMGGGARRTASYNTGDATYQESATTPSGIPAADRILNQYTPDPSGPGAVTADSVSVCDAVLTALQSVPGLTATDATSHKYAPWSPEKLFPNGARHVAVFPDGSTAQEIADYLLAATNDSVEIVEHYSILIWEDAADQSRMADDPVGDLAFLELHQSARAVLLAPAQALGGDYLTRYTSTEFPESSGDVRWMRLRLEGRRYVALA